jgi:hypothetical protein
MPFALAARPNEIGDAGFADSERPWPRFQKRIRTRFVDAVYG